MALDNLAGQPLEELLKEHAESIAALRDCLGTADDAEDQILLRFLLQDRGNVEEAEKKAKEGRQYRKKFAEVLEKAQTGERLPQETTIRKHLCFGRWQYPNAASAEECPPMLITRSGHSNVQALMEDVTVQELAEYFIWERRRCYDEVVEMSKAAGRLVVMISVNDLLNASLMTGREPKFYEAVKISSEAGACMFPLLTRKHVMVNSGIVVDIIFRVASAFMPQRVLDKVAFISCDELVRSCGVPPESFPDFLGGSCKVVPGSLMPVAS